MARRGRQQQEDDRADLDLLRQAAIVVFIILSALVVIAAIVGPLFRDPTFRVDAVVMGLVFGTLLSLLGLEGVQRLLDRDDK